MDQHWVQRVATLTTTVVLLGLTAQPAAAIHDLVGCGESPELKPLLLLVHQVVLLLFIVGALLAVVALAYAGIAMMWGTEDMKRRAIYRVQRVILGVGILWAGPFLIAFLLRPLDVCSGGG